MEVIRLIPSPDYNDNTAKNSNYYSNNQDFRLNPGSRKPDYYKLITRRHWKTWSTIPERAIPYPVDSPEPGSRKSVNLDLLDR